MKKQYQKGIKATQEQLKTLHLFNHDINGSWNYSIYPRKKRAENE